MVRRRGRNKRSKSSPRRRLVLAATSALVAVLSLVGLRHVAAEPTDSAEPPPTSAPPTGSPTTHMPPDPFGEEVVVTGVDWSSWTLMDLDTGRVIGSANNATETSSTESMIKAWIAADYLAGIEASGAVPTEDQLAEVRDMIHVSDDNAAESLYRERGRDDVIERLIDHCGLTETAVYPFWWSRTEMSSRDAARMGACLVNDNPAGPRWRDWLLDQMRHLDPSNAFGIPEALPGVSVATKNGWTRRLADGKWHLNCLGIWDHWSLAVMTRYSSDLGEEIGAGVCRSVTSQLFPRPVPDSSVGTGPLGPAPTTPATRPGSG